MGPWVRFFGRSRPVHAAPGPLGPDFLGPLRVAEIFGQSHHVPAVPVRMWTCGATTMGVCAPPNLLGSCLGSRWSRPEPSTWAANGCLCGPQDRPYPRSGSRTFSIEALLWARASVFSNSIGGPDPPSPLRPAPRGLGRNRSLPQPTDRLPWSENSASASPKVAAVSGPGGELASAGSETPSWPSRVRRPLAPPR